MTLLGVLSTFLAYCETFSSRPTLRLKNNFAYSSHLVTLLLWPTKGFYYHLLPLQLGQTDGWVDLLGNTKRVLLSMVNNHNACILLYDSVPAMPHQTKLLKEQMNRANSLNCY